MQHVIGQKTSATREERKSTLESLVLEALSTVRQAVSEADPDCNMIGVDVCAGVPDFLIDWVLDEAARRIEVLSPDWIITASTGDRTRIVLVRRTNNHDLAHGFATGGFNVTALQRQKLVEAGPAIQAAMDAVHEHFVQFGRNPDAWEVQFPTDGPALFVLRQAARRMQYYSADWIIEAHESPRVIRGTRKATPSVPAEVE